MRIKLIGAVMVVALAPSLANAQLTIDMNRVTCEQYLAMPPTMSRDFSAWMSGWFSYQGRQTKVDLVLHQKNIGNVKAWCRYHPRETVMAGLQKALGPQ